MTFYFQEVVMNNTVMIYESKYGSARRYAEWISKALSCQVFTRKQFNPRNISHYDTIIYGGGLYAGSVSGIKFITRNRDKLSDRTVILFTCGLMDPENPDNICHIRNSLLRLLPEDILTHLHLFHLRGGLDLSRLSLLHKFMMSILRIKKNL
jgi:menaquinone-dependent protoporphyrinogen IX oxidase